jgi:hypothetical protein
VLACDEPWQDGDAGPGQGRREQRVRAVTLQRDRPGTEYGLEPFGILQDLERRRVREEEPIVESASVRIRMRLLPTRLLDA